jgi:hypothetical protein
MANDKNKQEEQTQPAEQTTEAVSPYALQLQQLGSIGAEMEALQAKRDARQAALNDMQKRINDAKANQMSVLSAFVQQQKPVYDEKKEKRMRNRAMIQAFGDVLSEASKGYFAYNKKGAGVVPKNTPSNALEEVNKISEMQKKYLNDKKTWDNLNFEWQQKKSQADIDAADALLAKEEKYQEKLEKRIDELRKRGVEITDKIIDQEVAKLIKIEDEERDNQNTIALHEEMKQKKLGQYAPTKTTSRGGGGGGGSYAKKAAAAKQKEDTDKLKIYADAHFLDNVNSMYESEKEYALENFDNDPLTQLYLRLLAEGLDHTTAQNTLYEYTNGMTDEDILGIFDGWERSGVSLYAYLTEDEQSYNWLKGFYYGDE